jgi:MSHA pilin protein MshD
MSIKRARGFTLIEIVVFTTIVSIALAASMAVFSGRLNASADPVQPKQAMLVAESMLEEIVLKPYANPSGGYAAACPGTCARASFDDVGDYAGYASKGVYTLDNLVTPVAGLENYAVNVSVAATNVTATGNGVACLRVNVTVTVNGVSYTLSGYRFNYD